MDESINETSEVILNLVSFAKLGVKEAMLSTAFFSLAIKRSAKDLKKSIDNNGSFLETLEIIKKGVTLLTKKLF